MNFCGIFQTIKFQVVKWTALSLTQMTLGLYMQLFISLAD